MKKMKKKGKWMARILGGMLALSVPLNVQADTISSAESSNNTASTEVKGSYQPSAKVYKVDIAWGDLEFCYTNGTKGDWNPETHQYDNTVLEGWSVVNPDGNKITLTNHSNAPVKAAVNFTQTNSTESAGIQAKFTLDAAGTEKVTDLRLESADNQKGAGGAGQAVVQDLYMHIIDGFIVKTLDELGIVTVTISDAQTGND